MKVSSEKSFTELLSVIERNQKEWVERAPVATNLKVAVRSETLTIRITKEENDALERAAEALGVGKSSMVRMLLRQLPGLNRVTEQAATVAGSFEGHQSARGPVG